MVMPVITNETTLSGGSETEGGRRPTVVSEPPAASPELLDRPRRRTFTAADKLRILGEIDRAGPGGGGAILRREELYSSLLTDWRRQRDAGAYEALKAVKRGPKPALVLPPRADEYTQLRHENANLTLRLRRAEAIIEIQKSGFAAGPFDAQRRGVLMDVVAALPPDAGLIGAACEALGLSGASFHRRAAAAGRSATRPRPGADHCRTGGRP